MTRFVRGFCWALLLTGCGRGAGMVQGETDATHVDISPKVPGRVDSMGANHPEVSQLLGSWLGRGRHASDVLL